jgi:hypothetical protein
MTMYLYVYLLRNSPFVAELPVEMARDGFTRDQGGVHPSTITQGQGQHRVST